MAIQLEARGIRCVYFTSGWRGSNYRERGTGMLMGNFGHCRCMGIRRMASFQRPLAKRRYYILPASRYSCSWYYPFRYL